MLQSARRQKIDVTYLLKRSGEKVPVVDLFCGCGGLSKGFELAGFNVVAAYDEWQSALTCYNANFDHNAQSLDLGNVENAVNTIRPFNPIIIIGGPPCQEFSNAGKREEGVLADLTFKYAQIVTSVLPQYFVMENVPRVKGSKAYAKATMLYRQHNYGLTEVVLDASRCGAPQKRSRFFCIGALGAADNFLLERIFAAYTGEPITVATYFAQNNIPLDISAYYRHPTTYHRRAVFSVNEVAPTIRGVNRPRPATYQHHPNDAVPANELENITQLTLRQRASIQTFPQNYVFENLGIARCDLEQMIGNAVPVVLAQFVAEQLQNHIRNAQGDINMNERQAFSEWLRTEKGYSDRSISDVFSRLNRAAAILPNREINQYYIVDLEEQESYRTLSPSVRSQIKKAINLKRAFLAHIDQEPHQA